MRRLLALAPVLALAGCGILGGGKDRPAPPRPTAAAAPPAVPAPVAAAASPAGPITTNAPPPPGAVLLNEDEIPDKPPPPPPPPDPALLEQAIAPPPGRRAKPEETETALAPEQAQARLGQRLAALGYPALAPAGEGLVSGPALRNPGGFPTEATCPPPDGRPRLAAAWVEARIDPRRRGSEIQLSARFEEVRESPVRGVLVRVACASTGVLERALLAAMR